ncbi:hypothetical protein [Pedobacter sp. V48]|uniref:hypothetical protein n=1 Tax=Pedobacter sp. V48 TaxID=509635 RepID=UPI0003E5BB8C|nr:hypothetical protein [Pedobacter sp. V48]ETZ24493.1 hypothetical protein N824_13315 [Pedobacter sp. V48]
MNYKIEMAIKRTVYILLLVGILTGLYLYVAKFIKGELLMRVLIVYLVVYVIYLLSVRMTILNKAVIRSIFIIILIATNVFYLRYTFNIDLSILVVPKDFKGRVQIVTGDAASIKIIRPFNGVVLLNIDASGKINTASALNIKFNRLIIAEKSGDKLKVNNQLELGNIEWRDDKESGGKVIWGVVRDKSSNDYKDRGEVGYIMKH